MAGNQLLTVMELMGHKTITMTMRYAHISAEYLHNAIETLGGGETGTTAGTKKTGSARRAKNASQVRGPFAEKRAGDRGRTGDVQLGKLAFYH